MKITIGSFQQTSKNCNLGFSPWTGVRCNKVMGPRTDHATSKRTHHSNHSVQCFKTQRNFMCMTYVYGI